MLNDLNLKHHCESSQRHWMELQLSGGYIPTALQQNAGGFISPWPCLTLEIVILRLFVTDPEHPIRLASLFSGDYTSCVCIRLPVPEISEPVAKVCNWNNVHTLMYSVTFIVLQTYCHTLSLTFPKLWP